MVMRDLIDRLLRRFDQSGGFYGDILSLRLKSDFSPAEMLRDFYGRLGISLLHDSIPDSPSIILRIYCPA